MDPEPTSAPIRADLEWLLGVDLRDLTSESGWIAAAFCEQNGLSINEFRALLFVMVAEANGMALSAGDLRDRMGLSGAAITYLVDRMVGQDHLCRETDPTDRRRVILRHADHGRDIAQTLFAGFGEAGDMALDGVPDADLEAAHRVLRAFIEAMTTARIPERSEQL
ncbi:hypothetical protein MMAD_35020 [Mycolicibacterium madagascariense]|uniref:HTH marR-type domain-containing protein n=1 Tax=Mycolicibacterium madagascariense TaxID=212765 RepID=A0A7I7XJ21_9MYCO|nr:MarR family winged helix-turn-helix transcriptional regulator [Mycolicibacterium madagascariense]MCV7015987.1 winged helix-turn-helix transcriptional regulator [Mycolicibacterium madagascariense]BBZ29207.1 hypothetical protein MMAD_35020 [Mycolicibacterium madagascariense]